MKKLDILAFGFLTLSLLSIPAFAETKAEKPAVKKQSQEQKVEAADILGFRSAYFGMTMDQVTMAIEKDFGIKGDAVQIGQNMVTRTDSLSITVKDLLPDTGKAFVSYIFGYQSKGLIQINIVWNSVEDPEQTAETILGIGGSLQNYFVSQNFDKDKIATGVQTSEDTVMILRVLDKDKNAVVITMNGLKKDTAETPKELLLHMSYQANPENPDIYKIPKGKF